MDNLNNAKVSNVNVIEKKVADTKKVAKPINPKDNICGDSSKYHCVDVDSTTVENVDNTPVTPAALPGDVIVKVPVLLSEFTVQFNVYAKIKLPELALDIKDIKKRLKVTQCTLLQPTNILFIKGFVRKNIDYTTGDCSNRQGVCGDIRHCTIDVPFELSTPITFITPPAALLTNTVSEFEYFTQKDLPNKYFAEKDSLLAGDLSEINQFRTENFNELPFCELISANFYEFDEFIGRERPHHDNLPFEEKYFREIEEKMVIQLTLKLLQNRQVAIPGV
ncbi:MAG: hypothetical protein RIN55_07350 [Tissierellaceae bacterium]|nr:hypothetical protein [Tissierellaceae bacterium]